MSGSKSLLKEFQNFFRKVKKFLEKMVVGNKHQFVDGEHEPIEVLSQHENEITIRLNGNGWWQEVKLFAKTTADKIISIVEAENLRLTAA